MTERPLVTAVITTYERPELVKRAIRSVVEQTYDPLEIIVVEDASQTGVDDWLEAEGLDEVTYICHEENRNGAAARNTGIEVSNGKYVAFLDDDDEWKPQFIERLTEEAESIPPDRWEKLGVVYAALERRFPDGSTQVAYPENEGNLRESIMETGASTLDSSLFFPKHVFEEIGGWDASLPSGNVHDMWMSLASNGYHARTVDEPLVITYDDSKQMSTDPDVRIPGIRMYVEKWKPTYREWFGEEEGECYADRYFARVIGGLVAVKLVEGDLKNAVRAGKEVFKYSDDVWYNVYILSYLCAGRVVSTYFPDPLVDLLRRVIG